MIAVTCALRNGDAHKKNLGMLYERRDDARLAPAFDLICTEVYPELESGMSPSSGRNRCLAGRQKIGTVRVQALPA